MRSFPRKKGRRAPSVDSIDRLFLRLIADVKKIIQQARTQAYSAVNSAMVQAYWLIGRRIVKEEQGGDTRVEHGAYVIASLSGELIDEFGKGFSIQSLKNFRQFYLTFPDLPIGSTVWSQSKPKNSAAWSRLSWSHFKVIMRVTDPVAREWYIKESAINNWSVRTLDRNIASQYYQRLLASQVKEPVVREMEEKTAPFQNDKLKFIKNRPTRRSALPGPAPAPAKPPNPVLFTIFHRFILPETAQNRTEAQCASVLIRLRFTTPRRVSGLTAEAEFFAQFRVFRSCIIPKNAILWQILRFLFILWPSMRQNRHKDCPANSFRCVAESSAAEYESSVEAGDNADRSKHQV
jgi:hypothetical protein